MFHLSQFQSFSRFVIILSVVPCRRIVIQEACVDIKSFEEFHGVGSHEVAYVFLDKLFDVRWIDDQSLLWLQLRVYIVLTISLFSGT